MFHPNFFRVMAFAIPSPILLENFRSLVADAGVLSLLANAALVAFAVTLSGMAIGVAGGYVLSRLGRRDCRSILKGSLFPLALPPLVLVAAVSALCFQFHQTDAYITVALLYAGTVLPFCVWQLQHAYDRVGTSVEEAARIDGASRWRTLYGIVFPAIAPLLTTVALVSFVAAWNEYLLAALLLRNVPHYDALSSPKVDAIAAVLVVVPIALLAVMLARHLRSANARRAVPN